MAKITVVSKSQDINGNLIEGKVTPFGTSAHIAISKAYIGRKVKVIVPDDHQMFWIFDENARKEFVDACLDVLKKQEDSKIKKMKKETIELIKKDRFNIIDLMRMIDLLKSSDNKKYIELAIKVEKGYGL